MASVLAIYSKGVFEKKARGADGELLGLGDVFPLELYTSTHRGLGPLADGGALYVVTVRPPDESLWLVAVLESPVLGEDGWRAAPNRVPITDVTNLRNVLRFTSGKGITQAKGKLGMSLQTPRALTDEDVGALRSALGAAPSGGPTAEELDALALDGRTWAAEDGSEMVFVPGGDFLYGGARERRSLGPFAMAMHPVTNRQWARFVEQTGHQTAPDADADRYLAHWSRGECTEAELDHPVTHVAVTDAQAYCAWAGLALPTTVQWEKAARGTDGRRFPWGEAWPFQRWWSDISHRRAHVFEQSTTKVGTYAHIRTAWGCQDMIGNVSEMCTDEDGTIGSHVILRGSAYLRESYHEDRMSCSHSRRIRATARHPWIGFRPIYPC